MKRTLLQRGAIIAACAAAFVLGGCGDTEFDSRTDTVYSLETPQVTAKAYPGVNIVSWKPVPGASDYEVSIYEEGVYKGPAKNVTGYFCYDTELVNGKTYTYYVEATSDSNPGTTIVKAVYATNSRGEASARAIVPPANTEVLALPAYENGYDGTNVKTVSADEKWIINSNNINAFQNDSKIVVEFPMKAYLKYTVKYYKNDLDHNAYEGFVAVSSKYNLDVNNVNGKYSFGIPITEAGTYEIAVIASAFGTYKNSEEVISAKKVTVKALDVTSTENVTANFVLDDDKWADNADKRVRVSFTPATWNNDGKYVSTDLYTVYRRVKGAYENIPVEGKVRMDDATGKYYIDEEVDVTKTYIYNVVVTDGTSYGTVNNIDSNLTVGRAKENEPLVCTAPSMTSAQYVSSDYKFTEGASKLARVSFSPAIRDNEALPTEWHKVYRMAEGENVYTLVSATVKANDASTSTSISSNGITYYVEETISDVTKRYTYKVVVSEGTKRKESNTTTLEPEDKRYLSVSAIGNFNKTDDTVTWTVTHNEKAKLSARYLIVESNRDTTYVPVLANEVFENGTEVNLGPRTIGTTVVAGQYIAVLTNPTYTGSTAYIYLAVKAELDGYNTTYAISNKESLY